MLEHLVIPHQRTELLLEGVPCRPVRLEKIDCDLTDDVEVLRGIRVAHPGVVLAEAHVQRPVKFVLNPPVGADCLEREIGIDRERRDRVSCLLSCDSVEVRV